MSTRQKKRGVRLFIGAVQRLLAIILLSIVYVFGFGITALLMRLGRLFSDPDADRDSFWETAAGYESDPHEAHRQS